MKKIVLLVFSLSFVVHCTFSKDIVLFGTVDTLEFEFTITTFNQDGNFEGTFFFKASPKKSKRIVEGYVYGDCMLFNATVEKQEHNYSALMLERDGDTLKGWWVDRKILKCQLLLNKDLKKKFEESTVEYHSKSTNNKISGTYMFEDSFLTDLTHGNGFGWIEHNIEYGMLMVEELDEKSISFFAQSVSTILEVDQSISGVALKVDDGKYEYVYSTTKTDTCKFIIEFSDKKVSFYTNTFFGCEPNLIPRESLKVSNKFNFPRKAYIVREIGFWK